ncbi:hypothetical protein NDA01_30045 [Trichocoleus desertorum AS-A10]|uniref:hypothetical protein n=1 Tax=Trichocoleus desertorum TaxID=1481672 RepID=UPI00329A24BD
MLDLLQRFQELSGLCCATVNEKYSGNYTCQSDDPDFLIPLPCFDIQLLLRRLEVGPSILVIEQANQILRVWADEHNTPGDRSLQERSETWIEPTVIGEQVWAYPSAHAVMRIPVELGEFGRWEIAQPFYVQEVEGEGFETGDYARAVTTYALAAKLVLQHPVLREQIERLCCK